jgi:hypothetical protein
MNRDRNKPMSGKSSLRDEASSSPRGPFARSELNAIISNQGGPVTKGSDARKWFENKGWILESEQIDRTKLVNILLTVSLLPKIPPEVIHAIRAVAYILDDDITENVSDVLAKAVSSKVNAGLVDITSKLERTLTFLEASSAQQATSTLELKTATTKSVEVMNGINQFERTFAETTKSLAASAKQISSPPLARPTPPSLPNPTYNPSTPENLTRLKQRILQSSCNVLIQSDPDKGYNDKPMDPATLQELCEKLNQHLSELDNDKPLLNFFDNEPTDTPNRTKTIVRGIQIRHKSAYLLDFDTPDSAERFLAYTKDHIFLLAAHFGTTASIKLKNYPLIVKFVPCTGDFDPKNPGCTAEMETTCGLSKGAIVSANWIKRPDRRAPNQQVATLKVICGDSHSANLLLSQKVFIRDHAVTVLKDIHEPIRCNNCQEFGHIRANCKNDEICANCCSPEHKSEDCPPNQAPHCRACGPKSTHPSYSRNCPDFINRCSALDDRYPENSMPYYPTGEDWTWAMSPPKPNTVNTRPHPHNRPPPPIRHQATLSQFIKPTKDVQRKTHPLPDRPASTQPTLND